MQFDNMSVHENPQDVAMEAEEQQQGARRIVQLEETVINRIAAGEVVVRPANALKELLENSIDAGSTSITVSVKAGGLKMLRIEDNGHGIRTDDLPILCERFTTSKLQKYEDLNGIGTFGFRGEALASISHVSHVTVTTMTQDASCAYTAQYMDGKLRGPPKACAGTKGTVIVAEDMFYNNMTRRQALGKDSIEHSKILDVVQKYAIHYPHVGFGCRKATSAIAELQTPGGDGTSKLDIISTIHGQSLSRELFAFEATSEDPHFRCHGFASGPNWTARACTMTLFINNRLVECGALRRAVDAVYMQVLPRHQHPWIYLALDVDPATIDVNVHPTKNEVQFLHEESIAVRVQEVLNVNLRERGSSRSFDTKTPLVSNHPRTQATLTTITIKDDAPVAQNVVGIYNPKDEEALPEQGSAHKKSNSSNGPLDKKRVDLNPVRVRTDHRQQSLDTVWRSSQLSQPLPTSTGSETLDVEEQDAVKQKFDEAQQLDSIHELKHQVSRLTDPKLSKRIDQSVFVGAANRELALLQCGASLCLVNLARLGREFAYQRMLKYFGGIGTIMLKEPLPLHDVLRLGVLDPGSGYDPEAHTHVNVDALVSKFKQLLEERAEMLDEYFSLRFVDGKLVSLPNVLGVISDEGLKFDELPLFLIRLCCEINWNEEKQCLDELCRLFADLCVELLLPTEEEAELATNSPQAAAAATAGELNAAVDAGEFEDVVAAAMARRKRMRVAEPNGLQTLQWLYEAIKRGGGCKWPAEYGRDNTIVELASLDQLYRIFERC